MTTKLQIGLITGIAALLFVGLRSMPDTECTFLHYQSPSVSVDGIEFCGDDNPTFIDLDRLSFPVKMDMSFEEPVISGQEAFFALTLETSEGKILHPYELAITHTKRLHVLVVDESLDDYHHVHPEPLGPSGQWGFSFTPQKAGRYRVFAEFVPSRTQQKVIGDFEFRVIPAEDGVISRSGGSEPVAIELDMESTPAQLSTAVENSFAIKFGQAVELEPVMGALGHMVAFDEALSGFAHLHPKYTGAEKAEQPELSFAFNTAKAGKYRLWAQVKISGEERFFPFDIVVQ
ncbi:hypothetical protein [Rubellicoccus peritrichatus]|uniref:Secreted protein n=1 Tax=Rubellicoccus peritrichatus TaxID=3080537 RepID=A0AAQ3QV20_9BACT|nr:hypothetical protein [Puniceicoccus sp. CR14]WOO41058.1 hypothetical protein RZN69_20760 [Puniceicoccus sp. CR14]